MRSAAEFERSRVRIVRLCESAPGPDAVRLRQQVLEHVRRAVPFDAHVWVMTDPETSVGSAPLADVPIAMRAELPRVIRAKYLTTVNRWTQHGFSVGSLHATTKGDLAKSTVWRDVLARHAITDVASVVFRDRFGCWAFLDLWRAGDAAPFGARETAYLASITKEVTAALRRCQAMTFTLEAEVARQRLAPVILVLSAALEVVGQTPETREYLRRLVPPEEGQAPVPAGAYNVAAQLLAQEAGVDSNPPSARVHLSGGVWLTLRADRIEGSPALGAGAIAVGIEEASPSERAAVFARAFGLTDRERELLGHLMGGLATDAVAARMFVSQLTVQDHLKSIFAKTGVRSRPALLSRALGM